MAEAQREPLLEAERHRVGVTEPEPHPEELCTGLPLPEAEMEMLVHTVALPELLRVLQPEGLRD